MSTPTTPRLRSAFPLSPPQSSRSTKREESPIKGRQQASATTAIQSTPLIPLETLDAPTQRFYAAAICLALSAWKLYDYFDLVAEQANGLWLFMKWTVIDGVFLYGLPGFRIPWLEWSVFTTTSLFLCSSLFNAILMFRVPIPLESWLIAVGKIFYDRELAISERRVKAASLLQNSSLILGKQIIHILPEGSASLNIEERPFCLGNGRTTVHLPLFVNQTVPTSVELLRLDLESDHIESISITSREVKRLKKEADKKSLKNGKDTLRVLEIPIKQTGLYKLGRVLDESNLEVQRTRYGALVVKCPSASMKSGTEHRCKGDLSNFFIEIDATPPLRVDYTRMINRGDESSISLTWHPEDLVSPLLDKAESTDLSDATAACQDVSWAKNRYHRIAVNETMGISGGWQYRIDKVHDGCGNVVDYSDPNGGNTGSWSGRARQLEQDFVVHQRPKVRLQGCTVQKPLRLPSGDASGLPISVSPMGQSDTRNARYHVQYSFAPLRGDDAGQDNEEVTRFESVTVLENGSGPLISEPGIYRLQSVSSDFCSGEVLEPSSCMLVNPTSPDAVVSHEDIPDKCAGHSIGLLVNLDLVGSPPFTLYYSEQRRGHGIVHKSERISNLRHQLAFEPREAGHYTYILNEISDSVYTRPTTIGTKGKGFKLEQDIKPTAWARFDERSAKKTVCLDQKASFNVVFTGEGPWSLEYDLVHGKLRQKKKLEGLELNRILIETPPLNRGGLYSITLTSVTDRSGCKVFLDHEVKIEVRQEKPTAGFTLVNGMRRISGLHGGKVQLPLRLSGEGPWSVTYAKEGDAKPRTERFTASNSFIEATADGVYSLQGVSDSSCPGFVDDSAATFNVHWIEKPEVKLGRSERISTNGQRNVRRAVCQGEQDFLDIALSGNGPYQVEYEMHGKPDHGSHLSKSESRAFASNSASIKMETAKAGNYRYSVTGLGDQSYSVSKKKTALLMVEQRVHQLPQASFANAGKSYSYCKEDSTGGDSISVSLTGMAPFTLEVGIKHHASSRPELITFSNIQSNKHDIQVPKSSLELGGYSVFISRVIDSNGCQTVEDRTDREVVHVNVVDVPTISPIESRLDYCVGDRVAYTLSGTPPFNVFYSFEGVPRKAAVSGTDFKRLAERPGVFTINAVSDRASTDACRARTNITKVIHELPSVRISRGKTQEVDIHEGGETDIFFEFGGTPPFEFTYTRSTNAAKGKKSIILETRHDISHEHSKSISAYEEGTYEVVAIRDRYCGVTLQGKTSGVGAGQKLLT